MTTRDTALPTEPPAISTAGRAVLLELARAGIDAAIARERSPEVDEAALPMEVRLPAAAFVTLREDGELRGCMGRLDEGRACWRNVLSAAANAAVGDPRFAPVAGVERPRLAIEVSVLGPLVELADPDDFVPGRHGIVVERGGRRALLLPQVAAENGWTGPEMLSACCWKAGLPQDAWRRAGTRLEVFTALVFDTAD